MKKPRALTPPPKDTRKELYFEIESVCTRDWHDGKEWGEWESSYDSSLKRVSRNKDILDKWNFQAYQVNDEVYNAHNVYVVVVIYSTGDTFGCSEGHLAIAFVTEDGNEAVECKKAILEQDEWEFENAYSFREKTGKTAKWDEHFREHPKSVHKGYAPWNGYFESVTSVDIQLLTVMG